MVFGIPYEHHVKKIHNQNIFVCWKMLAVTYVTNILSYVHAVADIDTCNTLFVLLSLPHNVFVAKVID